MNVATAVATDECLQCLSPDAKRIGELEQQDGKARTCVRIGSGCRHVKKGEILTVGHTHLPAKISIEDGDYMAAASVRLDSD